MPRLAWLTRPALELLFRRSQICLGHNQFVRLDVLQACGGFPTSGATEDSTLGYVLGSRGVLIQAVPMVELTDLPETKEKVIRQNARWYLGVLDDIGFLWKTWRGAPTAFNLAQLVRHLGNKVVEWPVAAAVYPFTGWLGWYLAYSYRNEWPTLFYLGVAAPTVSLLLTIWVGGIVTQTLIERLHPYLPRPVDLRRKRFIEKFLGTFRCQTYWLLATRGAWRVLWSIFRTGRYEAAKTDRVTAWPRGLHLSSGQRFPLPSGGAGEGEGRAPDRPTCPLRSATLTPTFSRGGRGRSRPDSGLQTPGDPGGGLAPGRSTAPVEAAREAVGYLLWGVTRTHAWSRAVVGARHDLPSVPGREFPARSVLRELRGAAGRGLCGPAGRRSPPGGDSALSAASPSTRPRSLRRASPRPACTRRRTSPRRSSPAGPRWKESASRSPCSSPTSRARPNCSPTGIPRSRAPFSTRSSRS